MNNIKFKFWDTTGNKPLNKGNYLVDCDGVVVFMCNGEVFEVHDVIAVASTGLTDNDKNDIYYGDIYRVYGYGDLVIKNIHDVMIIIDAMAEGDLGDKLGDIYNNPELAVEADIIEEITISHPMLEDVVFKTINGKRVEDE